MKAKKIHSIGCATGIIDTFLVYGKYYIRLCFGSRGGYNGICGTHIFIAEGFNLFKEMDMKTAIKLNNKFNSVEEFEKFCDNLSE
jgi:hypothetical protein